MSICGGILGTNDIITIIHKTKLVKMQNDSVCSKGCDPSMCSIAALFHDVIDPLTHKIDEMHQMIKEVKVAQKVPKHHLCVNEMVVALQIKYPNKVWTSESFAEEIGCTPSAVRHTKMWKLYKARLELEKGERSSLFTDSDIDVPYND